MVPSRLPIRESWCAGMSLSEREQRILDELEQDLASSPLARWRRRTNGSAGRIAAVIAAVVGLLAGIAILSAGVALGVPGMMIGGAVLTQLCPALAWITARSRVRAPGPGARLPAFLPVHVRPGRLPGRDSKGEPHHPFVLSVPDGRCRAAGPD